MTGANKHMMKRKAQKPPSI